MRLGAEGGQPGEGQTPKKKRYIVAENGVVYHTDPDCVYLKPHVHEADASDLGHLRANDGSIYHPCEYCHPLRVGKYISLRTETGITVLLTVPESRVRP